MKLFIILFFTLGIILTGSAQEKTRIACVGNSITYGSGISNRERDSYPMQLGQMLGDGYEVRNYGFSARTMMFKADRPYMNEQMYKEALDFNPDIVFIKLGTNDSKDMNWIHGKDFARDLKTMINGFKTTERKPRIVLCYPCKAHSRRFTINDTVISKEIIPILRKTAIEMKLDTLDFHSLTAPHPEWFVDEIHPNPTGARAMAELAYTFITGKRNSHAPQAFPGKKSTWEGFDRYDYEHNSRKVTVVVPKRVMKGSPWIWRPAFFGAFPSVDKALLEKGFHVVYFDLTHLYGSPRSINLGNEFFNYMTTIYGLSKYVTLEGFSRGGMFALNWARVNPDKVACVYVDAPVCDLSSWPGKQRKDLWDGMKKEWELVSDIDSGFHGNPISNFQPLVEAGIPIMAVCGDADTEVPMKENIGLLRDRMVKKGGTIEMITKHGCAHHPHSLENPEPIVDFIIRHQREYVSHVHINRRGSLDNSLYRFKVDKKARVAFLGGSITEMRGWKEMVQQQMVNRFPDTEFEWVEAGISSLGSTPHAFRLETDVLSKGNIDLLFVEAAVNDDTNHFNATEQVRGMEGIIRHVLNTNPKTDIVMLDFIYDAFLPLIEKRQCPDVILNHERVANHYQVPSIDLNREMAERLLIGELTWKDFGGTHPKPLGHKYYNAAIAHLFDQMWKGKESSGLKLKDHEIPSKPLDEYSYANGRFIDVKEASLGKGWEFVSSWDPDVKAKKRDRFRNIPLIESNKSGSTLSLRFKGKAIGLYLLSGPDAAGIEYSIDKSEWKTLDTYTEWSKSLYLPAVMMLATELDDKAHVLKLRIRKSKKEDAGREECQIMQFVAN